MRRVVFVVNGTAASAMGERARAFAERLADRYAIEVVYRTGNKLVAMGRFLWRLARARPAVVWVFDIGWSGALAAIAYRSCSRSRLIVDTGDAIYELARSVGTRGPFGLWLTKWLERLAHRRADRLVVRGTGHAELLAHEGYGATVICDGVDTKTFVATSGETVRARLRSQDAFTVGVLGSIVWSPRHRTCYGWELLELLRLVDDPSLVGIVIGDGDGLPVLRQRAAEYGIENRVHFVGRVPYDELPDYLAAIDVCLSTQTNDVPGRVRTSGKLPLYLAAGRYVLASRVGEAARVLPPEMLVDFEGSTDPHYPERLAQRIRDLLAKRPLSGIEARLQAIAHERFDYDMLADRAADVLAEVAA